MLVIILNQWPLQPVRHAFGDFQGGTDAEGLRWSRWGTRCGRVIDAKRWREIPGSYRTEIVEESTRPIVTLREDHAALFTRPCRTCFPEETPDA